MAVFGGVNGAQIQNAAVTLCKALRDDLAHITQLQQYLAGLSVADLTSLLSPSPTAAADAQDIMSAVADAAALASIYSTGQPPGTYPQAPAAYVYANSQRVIIGPQ